MVEEAHLAPASTPVKMSQPKIPATFDRWFWTPDYRRGITILFQKLNAGLRESEELVSFVRKRAACERTYAHDLRSSLAEPLDPNGFGFDDGASFLSAYNQLRSSQVDLSDAHSKLALQLDRLVITPFESWSLQHKSRLTSSFNQVESVLEKWEKQAAEVAKLKTRYEQKLLEADEAEEDARFSPGAHRNRSSRQNSPENIESEEDDDDHTLIGQSGTPTGEGYAKIGKKVGEQAIGLGRAVSQRMRIGGGRVGFRALSVESPSKADHDLSSKNSRPENSSKDEETSSSSSNNPPHSAQDKGKGRADDDPPANAPPLTRSAPPNKQQAPCGRLLNIAGITKPPLEWSKLFEKARDTVYKQDVKIPLLGVYPNAHSGEDLVIFFKSNVPELTKANRAIEFCKELSEELAVLRLIGEIGNKFMATHDAYYLWKPEAFTLHTINTAAQPEDIITPLPERRHFKPDSAPPSGMFPDSGHSQRSSASLASPRSSVTTPSVPSHTAPDPTSTKRLSSGAGFAKILQTAVSQAAKGINDLSATVGVSTPPISIEAAGETREERLRREAESAEKAYASLVGRLDQTRLVLEQTISEHTAFLQRCELDRLRAAKAVIIGFNAALASLIPKMTQTAEISGILNESFSPESDVAALVERYRTGPFRPSPVLFHSAKGQNASIVQFGVDLSQWHISQSSGIELVDDHPLLSRLLTTLEKKYPTIESHSECRKTWIYEVPLRAIHSLRSALNNPKQTMISDEQLLKLDAPLIAATIKLWLLELDPPPVHWSRYEDVRAIYPQGSEMPSVEARIEVLGSVLSRLPRPHLLAIDAVISHLARLVKSTTTPEETDEVYLTKLGISVARAFLRPKVETAVTLSDKFQPIFLVDLISHYEKILPFAIELRQKLVPAPQRKHTKPIDMRVRRSDLGIEGSVPDVEAQAIFETHRKRVSGSGLVFPASPPSLPTSAKTVPDSIAVTADQLTFEGDNAELMKQNEDHRDRPFVAPHQQAVMVDELDQPFVPPLLKGQDDEPFVAPSGGLDEPFMVPKDTDEAIVAAKQMDRPFMAPKEQDQPFVPPKDLDEPFVPPQPSDRKASSRPSSRAIDSDDIPLASKSTVTRWGSGSTQSASSPRTSLGRSRGLVSGRGRGGDSHRPTNINTTTAPLGSSTAHKKASPSFDSIRSQFESKQPGKAQKGRLGEVPDNE